jgi:hypothetical protein
MSFKGGMEIDLEEEKEVKKLFERRNTKSGKGVSKFACCISPPHKSDSK